MFSTFDMKMVNVVENAVCFMYFKIFDFINIQYNIDPKVLKKEEKASF